MNLHWTDLALAALCAAVIVLASTWPVRAATSAVSSVIEAADGATTPPTQPLILEALQHLD